MVQGPGSTHRGRIRCFPPSWVNNLVKWTKATEIPPACGEVMGRTGIPSHMRRGGGGNVIDLAGMTVAGNRAPPPMWRVSGSSRAPPIMRRGNSGDTVNLMVLAITGLPNLTREVIIHHAEFNHGGRDS